jgi:hypothetical protein
VGAAAGVSEKLSRRPRQLANALGARGRPRKHSLFPRLEPTQAQGAQVGIPECINRHNAASTRLFRLGWGRAKGPAAPRAAAASTGRAVVLAARAMARPVLVPGRVEQAAGLQHAKCTRILAAAVQAVRQQQRVSRFSAQRRELVAIVCCCLVLVLRETCQC